MQISEHKNQSSSHWDQYLKIIESVRSDFLNLSSTLKEENEQIFVEMKSLEEKYACLNDTIEKMKHDAKLYSETKRSPEQSQVSAVGEHIHGPEEGSIILVNHEGQFYDAVVIHTTLFGTQAVILDSPQAELACIEGKCVTLRSQKLSLAKSMPGEVSMSSINSNKLSPSTDAHESSFWYSDLTTHRVKDMERMFQGVSAKTRKAVLERSMTDRRVSAIAEFCDVDASTSRHYLEKHNFNPGDGNL